MLPSSSPPPHPRPRPRPRPPAAKLLQPLLKEPTGVDKPVKVEILTRSKDEAENKKLFEQVIDKIGEGVRLSLSLFPPCIHALSRRTADVPHILQNKVGTLPKDKMVGKFVNEWTNVLSGSGKDVKEVDVALGVSTLLAVKDTDELVRPSLFLLLVVSAPSNAH